MKLILASHNKNKAKEIQSLLPLNFEVVSLADLNFTEEIEETESTFHGNSFLKANVVSKKFHSNAFADDSGLEVESLNNEPGVFSARYSGLKATDKENTDLLLKNLSGIKNRKARFVCIICLILNGKEYFFEGEIKGEISETPKGETGFGYDPIFIPENSSKTFAEMTLEGKNKFSHRAKALEKMIEFLRKQI
ncbi:MAG: RdgB/HAM1 family non-canonical purine NTP pyrophosphatase [Bacteroidota bacterium]